MMFRTTAIVALTLQLLGCVAPANAFILCISDDGCLDLELAAPGTDRCQEGSCDSAHASDGHGCADIPVLHDALGPLRAALGDQALADLAVLGPLRHDAPVRRPLGGARHAPDAAPPPGDAPRRSVVLQL